MADEVLVLVDEERVVEEDRDRVEEKLGAARVVVALEQNDVFVARIALVSAWGAALSARGEALGRAYSSLLW